MAKKIKRDKVNRSYDGIDREESTAGLMALRIFIVLLLIAFIVGTAALFAYNFRKEAENPTISGVEQTEDTDGAYYQIYDTDVSGELLSYAGEFYPIGKDVEPELAQCGDVKVNALMKTSFDKMCEAAAKDGVILKPVRGYMTHDECMDMFRSFCAELENEGVSSAQAEDRVSLFFPTAKKNEYRTGMLIKLSDMDSGEFEASAAYTWLYKNGVNYGFINRYTQAKQDITGIEPDLTVYRFVGTENAQQMRRLGMCLEEYAEYCEARR